MIEAMIMIAILALLGLVDKKPVFGQMTLTGQKALDWLKNGTNVQARKIWMGNTNLFDSDWNMPQWALDKGVCALIFPANEYDNPILVTQKSVLRVIEAKCMEWEAEGCAVNILTISGSGATGQIAEILFEENGPIMDFKRDPEGPTYAGYETEFS